MPRYPTRRRSLLVPKMIREVITRSGENRFAPHSVPIVDSVWKQAVGVRIAERAKPVILERGVLTVRAATSVWATELSLLSEPLIARLREQGVEVRELRFRVGSVEPPARPPERRVYRAVPPPASLPAALSSSLQNVDDAELRTAITHAARANLAWQANKDGSMAAAARPESSAGTAATVAPPPTKLFAEIRISPGLAKVLAE